MSEINEIIIQHLQSFKPSVEKLATEALRLSENMTYQSVSEQLKGLIRDLIREEADDQ